MGEVLDLGVQQGLIEKSGAWYAYQGDRIGQGRKNACDFLSSNPDICTVVEAEVRRGLLPAHCQSDESGSETIEASAGDNAY
jgi:recombination protein RecA